MTLKTLDTLKTTLDVLALHRDVAEMMVHQYHQELDADEQTSPDLEHFIALEAALELVETTIRWDYDNIKRAQARHAGSN